MGKKASAHARLSNRMRAKGVNLLLVASLLLGTFGTEAYKRKTEGIQNGVEGKSAHKLTRRESSFGDFFVSRSRAKRRGSKRRGGSTLYNHRQSYSEGSASGIATNIIASFVGGILLFCLIRYYCC